MIVNVVVIFIRVHKIINVIEYLPGVNVAVSGGNASQLCINI